MARSSPLLETALPANTVCSLGHMTASTFEYSQELALAATPLASKLATRLSRGKASKHSRGSGHERKYRPTNFI